MADEHSSSIHSYLMYQGHGCDYILESLPVLWNKQASQLLLRPMDLARTGPGRLLDRHFLENHLWSGKNFYEEFLILSFFG